GVKPSFIYRSGGGPPRPRLRWQIPGAWLAQDLRAPRPDGPEQRVLAHPRFRPSAALPARFRPAPPAAIAALPRAPAPKAWSCREYVPLIADSATRRYGTCSAAQPPP